MVGRIGGGKASKKLKTLPMNTSAFNRWYDFVDQAKSFHSIENDVLFHRIGWMSAQRRCMKQIVELSICFSMLAKNICYPFVLVSKKYPKIPQNVFHVKYCAHWTTKYLNVPFKMNFHLIHKLCHLHFFYAHK